MSKSNAAQQTQTTSATTSTDARIGIEGGGNVIAQGGSTIDVLMQSVDADVIDAALKAYAQVSGQSLEAAAESARTAIAGVLSGQDRALDTADAAVNAAAVVARDAGDNALDIVLANNALTETTREGNQQLVKLVADKLSTAVADERQNINAEVIDTAYKFGAAAVVGVAVVIGVTLWLNNQKAA